jgi:hypothetical protein
MPIGCPSSGRLAEKTIWRRDEPGHHVGQQYLPTALLGTYFYEPSAEATRPK